MAYNFPGLSGTAPPQTISPRGVGALFLGLPHRETAPAAPLIGTPLLCYIEKAGTWRTNQRSKKRRKEKKGDAGEEDMGKRRRKRRKTTRMGEERETSINYINGKHYYNNCRIYLKL